MCVSEKLSWQGELRGSRCRGGGLVETRVAEKAEECAR